MPINSIVLDKFDYGIISNPDAEDISDKAAVSSLNIDGDNKDGKLKGIPTSSEHLLVGSTSYGNVRLGKFIENDGVYTLIYHDKADAKIKGIKDFFNTTVESRIKENLRTTYVSDNVSMVTNNKEVHVGVGNGSSNTPRWIGHISHKQFGLTAADYRDAYTGAGLDDLTADITGYTGIRIVSFVVKIFDDSASPETFKWQKDGGAWSAAIEITTLAQTLSDGVTVTFAAAVGHTNNEYWEIITDGVYEVGSQLTTNSSLAIQSAIATTGTGDKFFLSTNRYAWTLSYIYDGYQESPLYAAGTTDTPGVDSEYYSIIIEANAAATSFGSFNRRITGINLYRTEYTIVGGAANRGLWKLAASIDINHLEWTTNSGDRIITIKDYGTGSAIGSDSVINYGGVSYSLNSGMPETLATSYLFYSLSTKGNGFHFVTKAYHPEITNADNYIFRSKELRFDMFDWVNDFLVMPRTPTALEFYEGKLYAFDANTIYRINPEGLYIEDAYPGVGALGQRSVLATPYGMFFCNDNGAYKYVSGQIEPISERIKVSSSNGVNWQTISQTYISDTIVAFDSLRNQVLFIGTTSGAVLNIWAYHVIKDRWDYWTPYSATTATITLDAYSGVFTGKDGEVYVSAPSNSYKLLKGGSQMGWEWTSKELNAGHPSQKKYWSKIIVDGTATIVYGVEGATPATAYTSGNLIDIYKKSIQIKITGTTTQEIDSIEILYRDLVGMR